MFFSILVPVFNTKKYLDQCIKSILNQTFTDYELILLDDGSTDGSGHICDSYAVKFNNIRVVHKCNQGLLLTRRRGFKEAQGEYCICVDSDDYLLDEHMLEKIFSVIVTQHSDMVIYGYAYGTEGDDIRNTVSLFDIDKNVDCVAVSQQEMQGKLLTGKGFSAMFCKAMARNMLDVDTDYYEASQNLKKSMCEDYLQTFSMVDNVESACYIDEPFYFYRWNDNGISKSSTLEFYQNYKYLSYVEDRYTKKWNSATVVSNIVEQNAFNRVMTLIIECYKPEIKDEWKSFVSTLRQDSYYLSLEKHLRTCKISICYRLLYYLIKNRQIRIAEQFIWALRTFK